MAAPTGRTPNRALPYPLPSDDVDNARNVKSLADALDPGNAIVTALPSPAYDGQDVFYLADATRGIVWHLKYRAGQAYPWTFVGGPCLISQIDESYGANLTAYPGASIGGPSVTIPRLGDYIMSFGARMYSNASGWDAVFTGLFMNNVLQSETDIFTGATTATPYITNVAASAARTRRHVDVPANAVFDLRHKVSNGPTVTAQSRWITATPIRLA